VANAPPIETPITRREQRSGAGGAGLGINNGVNPQRTLEDIVRDQAGLAEQVQQIGSQRRDTTGLVDISDFDVDIDFEPLNTPTSGLTRTFEEERTADNDGAPFTVPGMFYVKGKTGTAKGGVYYDQEGGQAWMVKSYDTSDQALSEHGATNLYRWAFGMDIVPKGKTVDNQSEGKKAFASQYVEGLLPFDPDNEQHVAGAQEYFAASAWLANWDVVGLEYDNLGIDPKSGKVIPIDVGGSLNYRAMGKKKGLQFSKDVKELQTLRDPKINPQAAKVFGGLTDKEIGEQVRRLANTFANDPGFTESLLPEGLENKKVIAKRLRQRLVAMMKQYPFDGSLELIQKLEAMDGSSTSIKVAKPKFKLVFNKPYKLKTDISTIETKAQLYQALNEEVFYSYKDNTDAVGMILADPNLLELMQNKNYDKWKEGNTLWWDEQTHRLKLFENVDNLSMEELYLKHSLLPPIMFHGSAKAQPVFDLVTGAYYMIDAWDSSKQGHGKGGGDTQLGMFLTDNPVIGATGYTGIGQLYPENTSLKMLGKNKVQPFVVNVNPFVYDYGKSDWSGIKNVEMANVAKARGHNALLTTNVLDSGGFQTQLIVFEPGIDGSKVKSPFSEAFDKTTTLFKGSVSVPGKETRTTTGLTVDQVVKLQAEFDAIYGKGVVNVKLFTSQSYPGYNAFFGRDTQGLVIGLKSTLTEAEARVQLHHEAIHFLKHIGHFNTAEGKKHWAVLKRHVQGRISAEVKAKYAKDTWVEEEIARFVERVARGDTKVDGALQKAAKWVSDFFVALANWGRGLGFTTAEQIAQKIISGSRADTTWVEATTTPEVDAMEQTVTRAFAASKELGVPVSKDLKQAVDWYGRITSWGHTVKQLAEKNTHIAWLQEYVQRAGQWYIKKMTWLSHADGTIAKWNALSFQEQENLSKAFFDIEEQVEYRDPSIVEQKKLTPLEGQLLKDNKVSKKGLQVYLQVRQDFRDMLNETERVAIADVSKLFATNELSRMIETAKIKKEFNFLRKHAYFPHTRFGEYTIVVKDSEGKTIYAEMFEREKSRDKAVEAVRKKFPDSKGFVVATSKLPKEAASFRGVPQTLLIHMKQNLELSQKQMAALEEMIAHSMPAVSFKHHFTKKERIDGFFLETPCVLMLNTCGMVQTTLLVLNTGQ
jgi:hypothetical protein